MLAQIFSVNLAVISKQSIMSAHEHVQRNPFLKRTWLGKERYNC